MSFQKVLLVSVGLLAVTLAGCAGDAPSGEFASSRTGLSITGDIQFIYTPATIEYPIEDENMCTLDIITSQDPTETLPVCTDAHTSLSVHVHEIPAAQGDYQVYLVGDAGEMALGALTDDGTGMLTLTAEFPGEDLSGMYAATEIRFNDFVAATAGTSQGGNDFDIPAEYASVAFTGTWSGKTLAMNTSGLPGGIAVTGWLVSVDEVTGETTHDVSFGVQEGDIEYEAQENIDMYSEVHIHVAGSSLNIGIADL